MLVNALRGSVLEQRIIHADEPPVQMLAPGMEKIQRAYVWAYVPSLFSDLRAMVYGLSPSRAAERTRTFRLSVVCDDYAGYKCSGQAIRTVG